MGDQNTSTGWRQVNLWCDDWQAAEHMAVTYLGPLLTQAEDTGSITCWWFVRKGESWRVRFLPGDGRDETAAALAGQLTTTLMERGVIHRAVSIGHGEVGYEPEIHAFGGADAMTLAHRLFHADSRHILHHLALAQPGTDHRREWGLLLGTRLMRAAGQDWYEQGDIWAQLAAHRITETHHEPSPATLAAVQRLLAAASDTGDSPLASAPDWPAAFEHTGQALADMAQQGILTRGLRAVLAHHLLFAFNRLGIAAQHQHVLATAASQVVFQREIVLDLGLTSGSGRSHSTTVSAVTTDTANTTTADPEQLRDALVSFIDGFGTFRTTRVKDAFRIVPRHLFLPGVDLTTAYAPKPVVTRRANDGTAVSSASSPHVVATMLEQLDVAPGHRVLEIGAATGINAALLAELVGPSGIVVTIELDGDLAAGARASLTATGYDQVEVLCGDGALGYPARAPYDRIIVTAGAWDIVSAWWHQLAVDGRLVVPLRLHGSGLTRSIAFDLEEPGRMVSARAAVCGFVPMRGAAEMSEPHVRLADDVILNFDADDLPDEAALAQALAHPAYKQWTGVQVRHDEPAEHLDLWLAMTTSGARFGRLSVGSAARAVGLVNPATRWSGAALYDGGSIAYLAARPASDEAIELGVIAHGPDSSKLAGRASELLHRWSQERPAQPIVTAYPVGTPSDKLPSGAHIGRP
ncbi:MAG TPA: methyltransferase, FxLD system, partial [Mycobacterium sp.]|nr:methyltransferase, FxLD system [Mycobacterium sp.]HWR49237.1 methyltransferase, FxLD system [Pseudonocardiaceae bacterium]